MKTFEVLLVEDLEKWGKKGNIVKIKPGYARNYLIPKGLATLATKENLRLIELQKKYRAEEENVKKEELKKVAEKLSSISCTIEAKANEEGHLFGSVTYAMIADAFVNLGFDVKAEDIELEQPSLYPIKELGIFQANVRLHSDITSKVKIWIINEQSPQPQ